MTTECSLIQKHLFKLNEKSTESLCAEKSLKCKWEKNSFVSEMSLKFPL